MSNLEEIRKRMTKEALEARRPVPPEYLVDALQDPIHKEVGKFRVPKIAKRKEKVDNMN